MKVETYKIKDWEETETGLLIAENEDWLLVKHIPVDYVVDGYKLYKKSFIESRVNTEEERQKEKVLGLKGVSTDLPEGFVFSDAIGLLSWVEAHYDMFEFQGYEESELTYGKLLEADGDKLVIDSIAADGTVDYGYPYHEGVGEIRVISFETDYHTSIRLLWKDAMG